MFPVSVIGPPNRHLEWKCTVVRVCERQNGFRPEWNGTESVPYRTLFAIHHTSGNWYELVFVPLPIFLSSIFLSIVFLLRVFHPAPLPAIFWALPVFWANR